MPNVLVTGGLGFIGSHTVDALVEKGYSVLSLDNLERQVHLGKTPGYKNEKAKYMVGDIRSKSTLRKVLKEVEYVIHLAALTGSSQSFWKIDKYTSVNALGTSLMYNILVRDQEVQSKIRKIIFASSSYIYGEGTYKCSIHGNYEPRIRTPDQLKRAEWDIRCPDCGEILTPIPVSETKAAQTPNPYSSSKYFGENIVNNLSQYLDEKSVTFRYFNVYGSRQSLINPYTGVMSVFYSRIHLGKPPIIFEDGKNTRDFIHVKDVADYNVLALEKGEGIYNVGTGINTTILALYELIRRKLAANSDAKITGESRIGDIRHIYADTSKISGAFGERRLVTLDFGISEFLNWASKNDSRDMFEKAERIRKYFSIGLKTNAKRKMR